MRTRLTGPLTASLRCLILCCMTLSLSCATETEQLDESSPAPSASRATTLDTKMDLPLAPPPHEWTIEVEERSSSDALIELLWSIYDQYVHGRTSHPHPPETGLDEEDSDCLDCGRETGFLPTPEMLLESVTPLDHKATSYVTSEWDEVEGANSYRVFLIQVDEELEEVREVSTTDVHTTEVGLGLDHGYVYVMYLIAYHEVTKDYSIPSEPLMLRCGLSHGCALLTEIVDAAD